MCSRVLGCLVWSCVFLGSLAMSGQLLAGLLVCSHVLCVLALCLLIFFVINTQPQTNMTGELQAVQKFNVLVARPNRKMRLETINLTMGTYTTDSVMDLYALFPTNTTDNYPGGCLYCDTRNSVTKTVQNGLNCEQTNT